MSDPDPTLADHLDSWAHADGLVPFGVKADLRAAAARLREQDAEITRLRRICEPLDGNILQARLDKLDRIEAALGDVPDWIDALEANIGNHCTVMSVSAQADLVTLFRRLADALEDTDG